MKLVYMVIFSNGTLRDLYTASKNAPILKRSSKCCQDRFRWHLAELFKICRTGFVCFGFHVVCLLSRYRLSDCILKKTVLMQKMLKVASLGLHTSSQSHLPLLNWVVD